VNFGNQPLLQTSVGQVITVINNGTANLIVSSVSLAGANAGDFALPTNTCTGSSLAPLATCSVTVSFTPTALGNRAATLSIASNDPATPAVVNIAGTGIAAPVGGVASVPTLSEWALIALNLMLACGVFAGMNRKETICND
jgi:hypothetical protein